MSKQKNKQNEIGVRVTLCRKRSYLNVIGTTEDGHRSGCLESLK